MFSLHESTVTTTLQNKFRQKQLKLNTPSITYNKRNSQIEKQYKMYIDGTVGNSRSRYGKYIYLYRTAMVRNARQPLSMAAELSFSHCVERYISSDVRYAVQHRQQKRRAKAVFVTAAVNGVLNVVWCLTFFTLRQIFPALAVILVNLTASVLLVLQVRRNGKLWFCVMLIYPVWITLATALNGAIWILN